MELVKSIVVERSNSNSFTLGAAIYLSKSEYNAYLIFLFSFFSPLFNIIKFFCSSS